MLVVFAIGPRTFIMLQVTPHLTLFVLVKLGCVTQSPTPKYYVPKSTLPSDVTATLGNWVFLEVEEFF